MSYYLRKDKKKKGIYLQMYDSFWDRKKEIASSKCVMSFGYVDDLVSEQIPDPIAYYQEFVNQKNRERQAALYEERRPRAFTSPMGINAGYFLLSSLYFDLGVRHNIDVMAKGMHFSFSIYRMIAQLIYARVICPCLKYETISSIFPHFFKYKPFSEEQIIEGCSFIGEAYNKYVELFNRRYMVHFKRNLSRTFLLCKNYYFKTPISSKDGEECDPEGSSNNPVIGLSFVCDAEMIPLDMQLYLYHGNESEASYSRKSIDEMNNQHEVSGKTIRVAEKGSNCGRDIYAAVNEAKGGYIFLRSLQDTDLSEKEKNWIVRENNNNVFTDYTDTEGKVLFRLKSCVDTFFYQFKEINPETGCELTTVFSVKEKRIAAYSPALAGKQRAQILEMADEAASLIACGKIPGEKQIDSTKYLKITYKEKDGKKSSPVIEIDQAKIDEDLKFAGYNLIVTSERKMDQFQIYNIYHTLDNMGDSFRDTMSLLDAHPVYLQKRESIYGHFLICYLALFLLSVLKVKIFKNSISSYELVNFIRDFWIIESEDHSYVNVSRNQEVNKKIKKVTGLSNLDALYFTAGEIKNFIKDFHFLTPKHE